MFKSLKWLVDEAVPKNPTGVTARGDIRFNDFIIDSTSVMEVGVNGNRFFTMAISRRDTIYPDRFENLVIVANDTTREAYIATYFADREYYDELEFNEHAPYIGGMSFTQLSDGRTARIDDNIVCKSITISFCNWSKDNSGRIHVAGPNCGSIIWTGTATMCEVVGIPPRETAVSLDLKKGNTGGGGGGGTRAGLPPDPEVVTQPIYAMGKRIADKIEDEIVDTELDECSKAVLNNLKSLTQNDISKIILKFDQSPSLYKLNIKTEDWINSNGSPAGSTRTEGFPQYNYTTRINPTTASNATTLGRGVIILHEIVHVYFFSLLDDADNIDQDILDDFPQLFRIYVEKQFGPAAYDLHHELMAEKYVDIIAKALQEMHTGIPVAENMSAEQIYTDLAWGSLQDAPIFNTTESLTEEDRIRINKRYAAEINNLTIGTQVPAGEPCQ